jgi:hypothetical protein
MKGLRYLPDCRVLSTVSLVQSLKAADYWTASAMYDAIEEKDELTDTELAFLGCNDRFYLLAYLCNRKDVRHPWLFDRCREVEADPDDRLDLWARWHYKSTIITFAGAIQEILADPEITIGIFAAKNDVARPFLMQIAEELAGNERLKRIYSDVLWANPKAEAPTWAVDKGIAVKRVSNPKERTVEAYGLIDGMPTGRHFRLLIYDDLVTEKLVNNEEQVKKCTQRWELSTNLGSGENARRWHIGTRYCTIGSMRILMSDWSHKPISEVKVGDEIVGWELRDGKRWLRPSKVVDRGMHANEPVRRFGFENGRTVTCTADHRWWRGAHGGGPEYAPLALPGHGRRAKGKKAPAGHLMHIRQLLVPVDPDPGREAGWLAGFYDGEGTFKKNKNHPSGVVALTQTMANPGLIEKVRVALGALGFVWTESWFKPSEGTIVPSKPHLNMKAWKDRCAFYINGGWRERYRFLAQIAPTRRDKIAESLFGQLTTDGLKVTSDEDAGTAEVHWLETETGNYVIEGFCSSNSYGDTYGLIMSRGSVQERKYPATHNGKMEGVPVFMSQAAWDKVKRDQRSSCAAQMLQNPLEGSNNMFDPRSLRSYATRPRVLNIYIMGDPSHGSKAKTSDRTAIVVVGVDSTGNKYLLDGYAHRMRLTDRWKNLQNLYRKWKPDNAPGVQSIKVGWERYGMQSDLDYFQEQMMMPDAENFPIQELNWTREGNESKKARVGRLEPDFGNSRFFLPAKVYVNNAPWIGEDGRPQSGPRVCNWYVDEESGEVRWKPIKLNPERGNIPYESKMERQLRQSGDGFLVIEPIQRRDPNDRSAYDLTRMFFEEFRLFPLAPHDDLIDATARIYDMSPHPAIVIDQTLMLSPVYAD